MSHCFRPRLCANARERHNSLVAEIVAATIMTRFIAGEARTQVTSLRECLADYITEDNSIRVVELHRRWIVDPAAPAAMGRPVCHPNIFSKGGLFAHLPAHLAGTLCDLSVFYCVYCVSHRLDPLLPYLTYSNRPPNTERHHANVWP